MPRLLVLHPRALRGENHGLLVQHVTTLAALLEPRGWTVTPTTTLDPSLAGLVEAAEVVVVQMLPEPEVEAITRLRRARGLPTVFEITDNFLGVAEWGGETHPLRSPVMRQHLLYHASIADALQLYAPGLRELFGAVNRRILRFDPYVPIPSRVPAKPPGFVLGWGGTRSHAEDVAAIAPVVTAFCRRHPDATFAYMGDRGLFDAQFGGIPREQATARPFGDHEEYLAFVGGLHVGLAPLRPTAFNATRTDTKFGTYAAYGVAAVLEDGPVHRPHADRALLFRTPEELDAALERLWADRALVEDVAARAREWALRSRSVEALAAQRDEAYRGLSATAAPTARPSPPDGEPPRDDLAARLLDATRLDPEEALEAARAIVAETPAYEQAHLLLARCLARLERHDEAIEHVERLAPSAVFADQFAELQVACARRVRPDEAARFAERIESPFRRARLDTAASVLERSLNVLRHQPYDHFALASAIKLLSRADPRSPELPGLFERAALVSPEDVPYERRPAALAPFLPA